MADIEPIIEQWYENLDQQRTFKVISLSDDGGVEVQYYGGTVTSYDRAEWGQLRLAHAARPVDWTGPMDVDKLQDDSGYTDAGLQPDDAFGGGRLGERE